MLDQHAAMTDLLEAAILHLLRTLLASEFIVCTVSWRIRSTSNPVREKMIRLLVQYNSFNTFTPSPSLYQQDLMRITFFFEFVSFNDDGSPPKSIEDF